MKTILIFTLILPIIFPASSFACPNELCVDEGLEQRLIDEELLSEVMLIAEDGVVEKEELENLFMLIEEKWGVTPSEFIDINGEVVSYPQPINSCAEYLILRLYYVGDCIRMCLEGDSDSCSNCLYYISVSPISTVIYCGYLFLIDDPILKIILFILDILIDYPYT